MDGEKKSSGSACWQPGGRWRSPELTGEARENCMLELGAVPGKGAGRPRKIHPVGQMVLQHLGQRREELMDRCRDRFRNFRVEVAVLFLAGYSPGMARGFFDDVFFGEHNRQVADGGCKKRGFSISGFERAYREVEAELMSGHLVGRIGPEWLAMLKEHGLGPWAPDAPEWMREKFGVSAEAASSDIEPPTGLPTAALGAIPVPVVPPSVAEIPLGDFVPLSCTAVEKSAAEKVRELDACLAGVEARFGPLRLQIREYTRALEVGFFAFMAEWAGSTEQAVQGSGDLSGLPKVELSESPADHLSKTLGDEENQALADPASKAKPDDSAGEKNETAPDLRGAGFDTGSEKLKDSVEPGLPLSAGLESPPSAPPVDQAPSAPSGQENPEDEENPEPLTEEDIWGEALAARGIILPGPYPPKEVTKELDPDKSPDKTPGTVSSKVSGGSASPPTAGGGLDSGQGSGGEYVELREFRSELVMRDPASLVLEGGPTFFPDLSDCLDFLDKKASPMIVARAFRAAWERLSSGIDPFSKPAGFTLFRYDDEIFEGCARHGYEVRHLMPVQFPFNVWVLRLIVEGMIAHAFGLRKGTVCPDMGKRFLQYADRWTPERAREMLAVGADKWYAAMNPAMVEARKPLRFEDVPPGYTWVPGWGLMLTEDVMHLGCLAGTAAKNDKGFLSNASEPELRKNELTHAKCVAAALGPTFQWRKTGDQTMEAHEFTLRPSMPNIRVFPEPFGTRFNSLIDQWKYPETLDLSKPVSSASNLWQDHGLGKSGELLVAQLNTIPTSIDLKSSSLVSELLKSVQEKYLNDHDLKYF